jgi:hypothetical protein
MQILISILLYGYEQIMECISQVEQIWSNRRIGRRISYLAIQPMKKPAKKQEK